MWALAELEGRREYTWWNDGHEHQRKHPSIFLDVAATLHLKLHERNLTVYVPPRWWLHAGLCRYGPWQSHPGCRGGTGCVPSKWPIMKLNNLTSILVRLSNSRYLLSRYLMPRIDYYIPSPAPRTQFCAASRQNRLPWIVQVCDRSAFAPAAQHGVLEPQNADNRLSQSAGRMIHHLPEHHVSW